MRGNVVPCNSTEVAEIKNTRLKIIGALETPASKGYVAKTMGAAPRSPTHERNNFFLKLSSFANDREIKTASGLAMKIKKTEMRRP
jgi:hypothetical protein